MNATHFLAELRQHAGHRLTVDGPDAMNIFLRLHPQLDGEVARQAFVDVLRGLTSGELVLPVDPAHWDTAARPAVPRWLRLKRIVKMGERKPDHRTHPWSDALRFVAALPTLRSVREAIQIDRWVREMPADEPWVPVKERSWELFGDEKQLERLVPGTLFGDGRLQLSDLRCYIVPCTPVHRMFPEARPRLIISENEAGFDSLCQAARQHRLFRCVVFGDGTTIEKAVEFLVATAKETGIAAWLYAGDVDPAGLAIAGRLAKALNHHGVPLNPWLPYYRHLLADVEPTPGVDAPGWLPPDLQARSRTLFSQGGRRAQEAVGWKVLRTWVDQ